MKPVIPADVLLFLRELKENNHREWMQVQKQRYQENETKLKEFYSGIYEGLRQTDELEKLKVFRIHRDIRFSADKTPYNVHRSASYSRLGAQRRGGYYLRIEPGNKSRVSGGFFNPEKKDLLRIRNEFALDASEILAILKDPEFTKAFGDGFEARNILKTAPRGFDKKHPNIDLLRHKNFFVSHGFTDEEVLSEDFLDTVLYHYRMLRPLFDYMSDILTTDLNGVSLLD